MSKMLTSTAGRWVLSTLIGGLMGFVVAPLVSTQVVGQTPHWGAYVGLAIVAVVLSRLAMNLGDRRAAVSSFVAPQPVPAAVKPPRKVRGSVDDQFGAGNVTYTVTPGPDGQVVITVRTKDVSGQRFKNDLVPQLHRIKGIDWQKLGQASAQNRSQAHKAPKRGADTGLPVQSGFANRTISGVIRRDASLADVVGGLEDLLGTQSVE